MTTTARTPPHGSAADGTGPAPSGTGPHARSEARGRPVLSVEEAAERAGVGARAIRKALAERRLDGSQLEGRWYVDAGDLEAYRNRLAARGARSNGTGRTGTVPGPGVDELAGALADLAERFRSAVEDAADVRARLSIAEASESTLRERLEAAEARALRAEQALAAAVRGDAPTPAPEREAIDEAPAAVEAPEPGVAEPPQRAPWWRRWWGAGA